MSSVVLDFSHFSFRKGKKNINSNNNNHKCLVDICSPLTASGFSCRQQQQYGGGGGGGGNQGWGRSQQAQHTAYQHNRGRGGASYQQEYEHRWDERRGEGPPQQQQVPEHHPHL